MKRSSCAGCLAALVISGLAAAALWVYLSPVVMRELAKLRYPEGAYVSDRPDLAYGAESEQLLLLEEKYQAFLQAHGLVPKDILDRHIATGLHYKHGLLLALDLSPAAQARLLRGMKRLKIPAATLLARVLWKTPTFALWTHPLTKHMKPAPI